MRKLLSTHKHATQRNAFGSDRRINWRLLLAIIWLVTVYGSFLRHSISGFLEKLGI